MERSLSQSRDFASPMRVARGTRAHAFSREQSEAYGGKEKFGDTAFTHATFPAEADAVGMRSRTALRRRDAADSFRESLNARCGPQLPVYVPPESKMGGQGPRDVKDAGRFGSRTNGQSAFSSSTVRATLDSEGCEGYAQTRQAPSLLATSEVYGQLEKAFGIDLEPPLETLKASSLSSSSRFESAFHATCASPSSSAKSVAQNLRNEQTRKTDIRSHLHSSDFQSLSARKTPQASSHDSGGLHFHRSQRVASDSPLSGERKPVGSSSSTDVYCDSSLQARRETRKPEAALAASETPSRIPNLSRRNASRRTFSRPTERATSLRPTSGVSGSGVSAETAGRRAEKPEASGPRSCRDADHPEWPSSFRNHTREFDTVLPSGLAREARDQRPASRREREVGLSSFPPNLKSGLSESRCSVSDSRASNSVASISTNTPRGLAPTYDPWPQEKGDARRRASRVELGRQKEREREREQDRERQREQEHEREREQDRERQRERGWLSREQPSGQGVAFSVRACAVEGPTETEALDRRRVAACRAGSREERTDTRRTSLISLPLTSWLPSSRVLPSVSAVSSVARPATRASVERNGDERPAIIRRLASLSRTSRAREGEVEKREIERREGERDSQFRGSAFVGDWSGSESAESGAPTSRPLRPLATASTNLVAGVSRLPPVPVASHRGVAASLERRRPQQTGVLVAELRRLADDVHALRDEYLDTGTVSWASMRETATEAANERTDESDRRRSERSRGVSITRRGVDSGRSHEVDSGGQRGEDLRVSLRGEASSCVSSAFASQARLGKQGEEERDGRRRPELSAARRVSHSLSPGQLSSTGHAGSTTRQRDLKKQSSLHASTRHTSRPLPSLSPFFSSGLLPESSLVSSSLSSRVRVGGASEASAALEASVGTGGVATASAQAEPNAPRRKEGGEESKKREGEERALWNRNTPLAPAAYTPEDAQRQAKSPFSEARRGGTERSPRDGGENGGRAGRLRATAEREFGSLSRFYTGDKTAKERCDDVFSSSLYIHRTSISEKAYLGVLHASVGPSMQASVDRQENPVSLFSHARGARREEAGCLETMKTTENAREQECGDEKHAVGLSNGQPNSAEVERLLTAKTPSSKLSPADPRDFPRAQSGEDRRRAASVSGVRTSLRQISGDWEARPPSFVQAVREDAQNREENDAATRDRNACPEKLLGALPQTSTTPISDDEEAFARAGSAELHAQTPCPSSSPFPVPLAAPGDSPPVCCHALSDPFGTGKRPRGSSVGTVIPPPSSSALFPASPSLRLRYLRPRETLGETPSSTLCNPETGKDATVAETSQAPWKCQSSPRRVEETCEASSCLCSCVEDDRDPELKPRQETPPASRQSSPPSSPRAPPSTEEEGSRGMEESEVEAPAALGGASGLAGLCSLVFSSLRLWAGKREAGNSRVSSRDPAPDASPSSLQSSGHPESPTPASGPAVAQTAGERGDRERFLSPSMEDSRREAFEEIGARTRARTARRASEWRAFLRLVRRRQLSREGLKPASAREALLTLAALSLSLPHNPSAKTPAPQTPHWIASEPAGRSRNKACGCVCEVCSEEWIRASLFSGNAPIFSANDDDLRLCKKDLVLLFLLRSLFRGRLALALEKAAGGPRASAGVEGPERPASMWRRLVCTSASGIEGGPAVSRHQGTSASVCGRSEGEKSGRARCRETAESHGLRRWDEAGSTDEGHDEGEAETRPRKPTGDAGREERTLCEPRECGLVAWAVAQLQTPLRTGDLHGTSQFPDDCDECVHIDFSPLVRRLADELGCLDTAGGHALDVARVVFSCSLVGAKGFGASFHSEKSASVSSLLPDTDCRRMLPVAVSFADWLAAGRAPAPSQPRGCLDTPDAIFALLLTTTARLRGSDASARPLALSNSVLLKVSASLLHRCASPVASVAAWLLAAGAARLASHSHVSLFAVPLLLAAGGADGGPAASGRPSGPLKHVTSGERGEKTHPPASRLSAGRTCGEETQETEEQQWRRQLEEVEEEEGAMLAEAQECWAMLHECCSKEQGAATDSRARTLKRRLEWNCLRLEGRATALAARRMDLERALLSKPPGRESVDEGEARDITAEPREGREKGEGSKKDWERSTPNKRPVDVDEVKAAQLVDLLWGLTVCGVPARPIFGEIVREGVLSSAAPHLSLEDLCCVACAFAIQASPLETLFSPDSDDEMNAEADQSPNAARFPEKNLMPGSLASQAPSPVSSRFSADQGRAGFKSEAASPASSTRLSRLAADQHRGELPCGEAPRNVNRLRPPSSFLNRNIANRLEFYAGLCAPYTRKTELYHAHLGGDLCLTLRSRGSFSEANASEDGANRARGEESEAWACEGGGWMVNREAALAPSEETVVVFGQLRDSWIGRAWAAATEERNNEFASVAKSAVRDITTIIFSRQTRQGDLEGNPRYRQEVKLNTGAWACLKYALRRLGAADARPWGTQLSVLARRESGEGESRFVSLSQSRDVFSIRDMHLAACAADRKSSSQSRSPRGERSGGYARAWDTLVPPATTESFPTETDCVSQQGREGARKDENRGRTALEAGAGAPHRGETDVVGPAEKAEAVPGGDRTPAEVSPLTRRRPERTGATGTRREERLDAPGGRLVESEETGESSFGDRPLRLVDLAESPFAVPTRDSEGIGDCFGCRSSEQCDFQGGNGSRYLARRARGQERGGEGRDCVEEEPTLLLEEDKDFFSFFGENDVMASRGKTDGRRREQEFESDWSPSPQPQSDATQPWEGAGDAAERGESGSDEHYVCDEGEDVFSEDEDEEEGILKPLFRFVLSVAIRGGAYAAYLLMGYALIILATTGLWVSSSAAGRQGPEDSALKLAARDASDAKLSFRAKGGRGYDKYGDF
ncbi:UNVERIFIED_CONTAM: hypothetical protein HHA_242260 [Hammondia hammondi]|eukprot:XP_008884436.1 hypothetical protein HHA_242260 [Hammondia hammondi]